MRRMSSLGLFFILMLCIPSDAARYRHRGKVLLNSMSSTPGATLNVTLEKMCQVGYTSTVRNVPESLKLQVCANYGIPQSRCNGQHYEIDHLISLELGGSNDEKNLWPQPYAPKPGAREKDVLENWLSKQVCEHGMPLSDAQEKIAENWWDAYREMVTTPR
jgi:hypothetical protein